MKRNEEGKGNKVMSSGPSFLIPFCLFLVPFLVACKPKQEEAAENKLKKLEAKTEQVVEATKDKLETLEQRFNRERNQYREKFYQQHLKLVARTNELKRRAELEVAKRPELERVIQKLEARTQILRDRLKELDSVRAENWDELKSPWQKKEGYEDYEDKILQETSM